MAEDLNPRDLALQYLFTQLCRLSPDGDDTAASMTLRTGEHRFVGDVHFSDEDIAALTIAVESLADAKECTEESTRPGLYATPAPAPTVHVDPNLENELEEFCIGLNVDDLMAKPPAEAVAEFDLITSDQDGEL